MRKNVPTALAEIRYAKSLWGQLGTNRLKELRSLLEKYQLSVSSGDITILEHRWYITHTDLLGIAFRSRCLGIRTTVQAKLSDPAASRWIFKAVVHKSFRSRGFVGYGDADPSNVSPLVRGAEMRVAETRAVNRALRKAYGIGLCSVEELGWSPRVAEPGASKQHDPIPHGNNGHGNSNGQPRLRDRLCLLIRRHKLDATLVKAYAADYCGTAVLRDAKKDLVEAFVDDLEERATKDREALLCHLNSYSQSQEVNP